MGKEAEMTLYAWCDKSTKSNELFLFFALADNRHDAIDKILLKTASKNPDTAQIIRIEEHLRSRTPAEIEFLDGAGVLSIDLAMVQK